MITLVRTGMQASERVRLTGMPRIDVGHAIAWTALLRQGKRTLGRAADAAEQLHHEEGETS